MNINPNGKIHAGEIYISDELMKYLNLRPGDGIGLFLENGEIKVRKVKIKEDEPNLLLPMII